MDNSSYIKCKGIIFRAITHGICELISLYAPSLTRKLAVYVGEPVKLYYDNKAAIQSTPKKKKRKNATINVAHNPIQNNRTNHVEIDRHFIKE